LEDSLIVTYFNIETWGKGEKMKKFQTFCPRLSVRKFEQGKVKNEEMKFLSLEHRSNENKSENEWKMEFDVILILQMKIYSQIIAI